MKVIRPVKRYIESAEIESKIITNINSKDVDKRSHCINIKESFHFHSCGKSYYGMIFEKVGLSLFEFIKMNKYRGYSLPQIQSFAKQVLEGISYLHSLEIVHTDLKPENILLVNSSYDKVTNKKMWPSNVLFKEEKYSISPSTRSYSREKEDYYCMPKSTEIKIIDFGGAVYFSENRTGIINTRQYRSPEVILGCCPWDEKSDVWSIACILSELYNGELLFGTHDNEEHLCLIQKVCGKFPLWMGLSADDEFKSLFSLPNEQNENINFETKTDINVNKVQNIEKVKDALEQQETLNDIIMDEHEVFRKFLMFLLEIDPKKRPSCSDALNHDFFKTTFKG